MGRSQLRYHRYLLSLLICCLAGSARAQGGDAGVLHLTKDSLSYLLYEDIWRFTTADLPHGADTDLADDTWPLVDSRLFVRQDTVRHGFRGICWLRLHLETDTSLAGRPLALRFRQTGASEVYLDGRLIRKYGRLIPADSSVYVNPQELPLILTDLQPGRHIVAIRYANWDYRSNWHKYSQDMAGTFMTIESANGAVRSHADQLSLNVFIFMLLAGIFVALSMVHLILYMYYRAEGANARFSFLAICIALLFLIPAIIRMSADANLILQLIRAELLIVGLAGFALSFLLNGLFSRRRWHFYLVVVSCIVMTLIVLFWRLYAVIPILVFFAIVSLETVYILVSALWRRMPGARIIGGGLILLIALLVVVVTIIAIQGDIYLGDDSQGGRIFMSVLALAILSIPVSMSMYLAWRFSSVNLNLKAQLEQVESLSNRTREQEAERQRMLEGRQEELEREVGLRTEEVRRQHEDLKIEKQKSDDLLLNILPAEIADELKETGGSQARLYEEVSVLFTDFVAFTQVSEKLTPSALVAEIDYCFKSFDRIIEEVGLEKIKTVGDAYIAVAGLPVANAGHAVAVVTAALKIRSFMAEHKRSHPDAFDIRIGAHSGPVVAGIVGLKKYAYDIWGDTVNTAARMEQHSEPGKVNISATTYALVRDNFACIFRGDLEAKHKGKLGMYFVQ